MCAQAVHRAETLSGYLRDERQNDLLIMPEGDGE